QGGDWGSRLAVLFEGSRAGEQGRVALGELADRLAETFGQGLALMLFQLRLGVEQIDGAGAADQKEEDDGLGLRLVVRFFGSQGVGRLAGRITVAGQQPGEGERPATAAGLQKEVAAGTGDGPVSGSGEENGFHR